MLLTTSLVAALTVLGGEVDPTRQWPAWRGPMATGVSTQADPPIGWSESKNVRWKVAVPGRGTASPVVWGDRVYVLTAVPVAGASGKEGAGSGTETRDAGVGGGGRRGGRGGGGMSEAPTAEQAFTVMALDRGDGHVVWTKVVRTQMPHEGHHRDHGFASASPVTDGEVLIAHFGSFGTYALDLSGRVLWEKDLGDMQTRNSFGEGSSPLLAGEVVVILWDHEGEDFIVGLDRKTGRELWRQKRDEPTGWCTPVLVESGGRQQVVVNGTNRVRAYDLKTGEPVWESGGQTVNAIPTAVASKDRVSVTSGYRGDAMQAFRLDRKGDLSGTDGVTWSLSRNTPYVPSPLLVGGLVYFLKGNEAMLSVVDAADGTLCVDGVRLEGMNGVYASPVSAAGRVYVAGRDGKVTVLRAGRTMEVLARNTLDDGFDASPALAGDSMFLRGRTHLYCIAGAK